MRSTSLWTLTTTTSFALLVKSLKLPTYIRESRSSLPERIEVFSGIPNAL